MKDIIDDNEDKAVIIGAHYSGDLQSAAASELVGIFGGAGQPVFFADKANLRVSRNNTSQKRQEARNLVDANFNTSPIANAGLEIFDRSGDLEIDVRVEFFENTSGTYHLGVLILENNVINNQASQGNNASHPFVLRSSANGVTGDEIASGMISAGTTKDFSFTVTPDANWDVNNLSFAAVIWKENGGSYDFVNIHSEDEIQLSTSSTDINTASTFTVRPSIIRDMGWVDLDLIKTSDVRLIVHDLLGAEIATLHDGVLPKGQHRFEINRSVFPRKGMYLLSVDQEGQWSTKRFMIE